MIEKVNPGHPDKVADRIAGAIVDLAYRAEKNPKIAVEVLIGHGRCHAIIETTAQMNEADICSAVARITGNVETDIVIVPQDAHLSDNQADGVRCGDNGIFKGMPLTAEQKELSQIAHKIYEKYPADGKYILDGIRLIICQIFLNVVCCYKDSRYYYITSLFSINCGEGSIHSFFSD